MFILTNGQAEELAFAKTLFGETPLPLSVAKLLPKRKRDSHKGDYGKAAIVAGGAQYSGAAHLAMAACLRSGAGYTTLFTPSELLPYFYLREPEALLVASNEGGRYAFNAETMAQVCAYSAVAYGMGMGESEEVARGACYLLTEYKGKLILDADGINSLAKYRKNQLTELLQNAQCDVVLTPHCKEFSRITGEGVQDILQKGFAAPCAFAKAHGVTVLLKNAFSVITDGERLAINLAGSSGQAKGGSGDVLSGVLAGLCAQGASVFDGACAAAYLTGKAAEFAAVQKSAYAMLPRDVIECLPQAFLHVTENADQQRDGE